MAMDRHGMGLTVARICIGVFFIFEAIGKWRWLTEPAILASQLSGWAQAAPSGSINAMYLARVAQPYAAIFARLVPIGELSTGIALVLGFWTPLFAFIGFFMALNFQIGSGAIFKYSFLTSGYGLPVLGTTLGLAVGGVRLPWSLSGAAPARTMKVSKKN